MGSSLLFSPIITYCLNIWRHRFLHVILYLALILNFLLLLVLHWFYWHLYLCFYIIAVIIHFKAQIAHLWLLCSFDNCKCLDSFLAFGYFKESQSRIGTVSFTAPDLESAISQRRLHCFQWKWYLLTTVCACRMFMAKRLVVTSQTF